MWAAPEVSFDSSRQFTQTNPARAYETGPLDRPSVYVGGNGGGHELDAGLTWDRVYDDKKRPTFTDKANGSDGRDPAHRFAVEGAGRDITLVDGHDRVVARGQDAVNARLRDLKPNHAFRPHWRTTNPGQSQAWHNPTGRPQTFKRVNALDQFRVVNGVRSGLEGANILPMATRVEGARWEAVEIIKRSGRHVPLSGAIANDVRSGEHGSDPAVYDRIFRRQSLPNGGERIDLRP